MAARASAVAPARRELGVIETSWCTMQEGGTGITVSGLWFARPLSKSSVQLALNELINQLPSLNSHVRHGEKNKLNLELRTNGLTVREEVNPFIGEGGQDGQDDAKETWSKIVDLESNMLFPSIRKDGCSPVFQVALYKELPDNSSLVVLRFQTCAFDLPSVVQIQKRFIQLLRQNVEKEENGESIDELLQTVTHKNLETLANFTFHPPLEEMVPKGAADKSVLSMGVNMLSYGVAASKQRYIPFTDVKTKEKQSRHIRTSLSREATDRLAQACKRNSADFYGALSSAILKSIADYKRLGKHKEHHGVAVLFNTRNYLSPPLPQEAIGFYNTALLFVTQVTQGVNGSNPFWKVATDTTKSFDESIKNQKHFKDMKDLNHLMMTAAKHPGVTPEGTLRTATLSMVHDPVALHIPKDAAEFLRLKDHIMYASTHGVGPCMAVYTFLNDGALETIFVYPSPLFSRAQMQTLVDNAMKYLMDSS